jgi:6-pyruvoyltetrahydropterin/6-carboxytetrahydropterin synthase
MVEIAVEGEVAPETGYLIDYGEIRRVIDPVQKELDHRCLNEIAGLENPTSEVLARWIWDRMKPSLPILVEVIVHETCTSTCHYRGR